MKKPMKMKKRIELIQLLSEEIHNTAMSYYKEKETSSPVPVYYGRGNIGQLNCRESIKRRIKVLREELQELSKML